VTNRGYHHGQIIKEFRKKRGISIASLAEQWPNGAVNPRYIGYIESGKKQITNQNTLRQLSELLDIPLWHFGLSEYNPFNSQYLPGRGERMLQETLDTVERLIQQTWYLRRKIAPLPEAERSAQYLHKLFNHLATFLPPPSLLEPRFLRLYAQVDRLNAVMHVERKQYTQALETFSHMYTIAKQLEEPYFLTLALMNMGVELERAGEKQKAIEHLEKARDLSFQTSKKVAAMVHSYLARAYASNSDALRFQRAIETAQTLMNRSKQNNDDDTDQVHYSMSSILAELSYGYPEIGEPRKTLDMQEEITCQIKLDLNTRLHSWIPLDWARAYFMLNEIEESVKAGIELLHRALETQSPHIISRAYDHIITLEEAGYADLKAVQEFREELNQVRREQENGIQAF
jgi:tetratricopeptide (TPR) repeat protein